ncbi:MAG TPA: RagB/SusD family nutrient uptake outer membrane protein [Gemmatimonadales bacterium]|nr:RagB/SusD family nutrient uptake outer membrane protein [Gemmatimonadales bacterium]
MNKTRAGALLGLLVLSAGCRDFLDVNTNPNGPQSVSANLYLPPMLHWMVTSPQFDGRFVGHYTQQWISTSTNFSPMQSWGKMGYDPGSDNGAQQWRDVYWSLGQNLIDMNAKATAEQRWDLLGVGLILKAWGWQVLTDLHGEIIVRQAIDQTRTKFDYDTQEYAYQEVERLLDSAIVLLKRTDGAVDQGYLAVGDHIYNGDRTKWLKLASGMLALTLNHHSNKASYDPARVIRLVDSSFTSNADDALLAYPCTSTDFADCNFWGRSRNNATLYRQTQFVVGLMDGTQFGGTVDPRMSRMLAVDSANTTYRGLDINALTPQQPFGPLTVPQQPRNLFGYVGSGGLGLPARYIFADRSRIPVLTYAELQFIKAEAALRMANAGLARTAYVSGVSSHIDFVNTRNLDAGQTPTQITATEKATFLADTNIVPATITLSHIMSQKFIALWGWGHNEIWMDMRRYHYTYLDPASGTQVFRGFTAPSPLFADNVGKVVERIRPRFNSEYVWNRDALATIGGLDADYHTKELWITQP